MDAYRIGITVAMTSNASTVLQGVRRDVVGLGGLVDKLTGSLGAARMAMKGLATPFVGTAAVSAMGASADIGKDLVHRQALFQQQLRQIPAVTLSQPIDDTASTPAQARKTANAAAMSNVAENSKSTRQFVQSFGDVAQALRDLTIAQVQSLATPIRGNQSGEPDFGTLKPTKLNAATPDPRHFTQLLDATVKAAVVAGSRLLGSNVRGTFELGGIATPGRSDSIFSSLTTLIGALKPGGGKAAATEPGRGLIAAIPTANKAALQLERLPPVQRPAQIATSTSALNGERSRNTSGGGESPPIPYQWVRSLPLPPLRSAGIADPDKTREQITRSDHAAPQLDTMFAPKQQQFRQPTTQLKTASRTGADDTRAQYDPAAQLKAFHEAWRNLRTALGAPLVNTAAKLMVSLTDATNRFTQRAATAVGFRAGPAASGIEALGKAFFALPHSLMDTVAGAAVGAAAGSVLPGVGTVAGATAGAGVGLAAGALRNSNQPRFIGDGIGGGAWLAPDPAIPPPAHANAAATGPVPVYVVNGLDIAHGTTAHQASQLALPPAGPSGGDPRMNLSMPGHGAPAFIGP